MGDGGILVAEGHGCNFTVLAHSLGEVARSGELHGVVDGKGDLFAIGNGTSHIVGADGSRTRDFVFNRASCGRGGGYSGTFRGAQIGGGSPSVGNSAIVGLRAGSELCAAAEAEVGVAADGIHRDGRCVHGNGNTLGVGSGTAYIVGADRSRSCYNVCGVLRGRHGDAVARFLVAPSVGDIARIGGGFNR